MTKKVYYLTTPLYYVNDVPHIGHAYTTIASDVLARWKRLEGNEVFFQTGTDEHGAKIAQAAQAGKTTPQKYADRIVEIFKTLWERLNISHDYFIRTTDDHHKKAVQIVFKRLMDSGDIYKGTYEDWYCTPCETFWSEKELVDMKCPTCDRPVEKLKEESYFFKLSNYEKPLLDYYKKNPEFLSPKYRALEIINFVKEGLRDLSVSRTKVKWGVPVPGDENHTVYVWFDALLNYITGPGFGESSSADFEKRWPADVQLVGKEIYRFHTVIWPAMLMALGISLPKRVFAHGWWTVEGDKMSKSKGNVVDPHKVSDEYGVDALRYFLLREVPFGGDGDFTQKALLGRYNAELANALGNLLNRTLNLIEKNFEGVIPELDPSDDLLSPSSTGDWLQKLRDKIDRLVFHEALQLISELVNACNKYMDEKAPWKTVKTDRESAARTLYEVARALKLLAVGLHPFMPTITQEMWNQLGESTKVSEAAKTVISEASVGFQKGQKVAKGAPLFPRKDASEPTGK